MPIDTRDVARRRISCNVRGELKSPRATWTVVDVMLYLFLTRSWSKDSLSAPGGGVLERLRRPSRVACLGLVD